MGAGSRGEERVLTSKKGLKHRVRERAVQTGERYTEALEKLRRGRSEPLAAARPGLVEEWHRADEQARSAGLACGAIVTDGLWTALPEPRSASVEGVLRAVRGALDITATDPAFVLLRSSVLSGEPVAVTPFDLGSRRMFAERLRAGLRGVSPDGCDLALDIPLAGKQTLVVVSLGRSWSFLRGRTLPPLPPAAARWVPPNPCVFLWSGANWLKSRGESFLPQLTGWW